MRFCEHFVSCSIDVCWRAEEFGLGHCPECSGLELDYVQVLHSFALLWTNLTHMEADMGQESLALVSKFLKKSSRSWSRSHRRLSSYKMAVLQDGGTCKMSGNSKLSIFLLWRCLLPNGHSYVGADYASWHLPKHYLFQRLAHHLVLGKYFCLVSVSKWAFRHLSFCLYSHKERLPSPGT